MPELPEVEIVVRNLSEMIKSGDEIRKWEFFRKDLRFAIPRSHLNKLISKPLRRIGRRAKYILFYFDDDVIISHLGMTGSWRQVEKNWKPRKHDHLAFEMNNNKIFVYEDPRRFGFIEVFRSQELNARFGELGVEPLEATTDFNELTLTFKELKSPIKTALMNQKLVVGVGNIYASEVLFRAGINPLKSCSRIKISEYSKIWNEVVSVLNEAISRGGSTIENYKNGYGEGGNFQKYFFVYGRESENCYKCKSTIKSIIQSGRSSFWCPTCQKK